jgi:ABC-type antimicrobial peptide transport system permease subunit
VRARGAAESRIEAVRAEIAEVDPSLAVFNYRPMSDFVAEAVAPERDSLGLLSAFGLTGFLLALLGVYGVLSHTVSSRRPEFGLRLALGASPEEILRLVLVRGALLLALGVGGGLLSALGLAPLSRSSSRV